MTADYSQWLAAYGPVFVMAINFVSCLGAPIPALVVMLVAGAWAAQTDAALLPFLLLGYLGAVLPGLAVFWVGRRYGREAVDRFERRPALHRLIRKGHAIEARWGGAAVFLGASFAAQVGPAVNLLAGSAGMRWRRFHPGHLAGRAIWVGGYTGLGFVFSDNLQALINGASRFSTIVLIIVALAVCVVVWRIRKARA